jgi:hypothetical protein
MNQPIGATLASVLHLRLADFGSKAVVEQARLRASLEAVVATSLSTVPERDRIVLDAPDGLAVAVLGNPAGAFKLAQRCLEAAQVLPLCIGAHHGAVATGGMDDTAHGLLGDGVRSAGVAASFAKPSQILVTRAFRDALAAHVPMREAELRRVGTFADDSVRTYELFRADPQARRQRRKWLVFTGLFCIAIGVIAGTGVRLYESGVLKFPQAEPPQATAQAPVAPAQVTPAPAPKAEVKKAPPPPPPAVVTFEVSPEGQVYVDGKFRGNIPVITRLELRPGRYEIEVRFRKETPFKQTYVLRSGQKVTIKHVFFAPERFFKKIFKNK